jgi:transcriptional regulator with XRE-family HTH domain
MNSSPQDIQAALIHHRQRRRENQKEFAKFVGISPGTLSEILNNVALPSSDVGLRLSAALVRETEEMAGCSSISEPKQPSSEAREPQPLGRIPFEGRDWKMTVPFYEDDALTQKALAAARALVKSLATAPAATPAASSNTPSVAETALLADLDRMAREKHAASGEDIHGKSHPVIPFRDPS